MNIKQLDKYVVFSKSALFLGFVISLIGTLPLGYINVVGLQVLLEKGIWASLSFIFGVVFVEFFVMKIVSSAAKWIVQQKKLLLIIDIFTITYFTAIAIYFIININKGDAFTLSQLGIIQKPFVLGVILNSLNFMQWTYWSGIYIYLFRNKTLKTRSQDTNFFILGALAGTFIGIVIFTYAGMYILVENGIQVSLYLNPVFASLFLGLALAHFIKIFWKREKVKKAIY